MPELPTEQWRPPSQQSAQYPVPKPGEPVRDEDAQAQIKMPIPAPPEPQP